MLSHYFKKDLSYIGCGAKGKQVRDVLHIDDLFRLIDLQVLDISKASGKIYNAGGGRERSLSLLETTEICKDITGNKIRIGKEYRNRPGDIAVYITDSDKVMRDFQWAPRKTVFDVLGDIYSWIRNNEKALRNTL
jgi:CDP-paratose 2-epimerase